MTVSDALDRAPSTSTLVGWGRSGVQAVMRFAARKPLGAAGAIVVVVFFVLGAFASSLTPYSPTSVVGIPLQSPGTAHWLGTDSLGRDVFSRLVAGAQISLTVALTVTTISVIGSTVPGLISGYYQGWLDYLIQRSGEAYAAFPSLVLYALAIAVFGRSQTEAAENVFATLWDLRVMVGVLSVGAVFGGSRIIRGAVLSLKQQDFVMAARAMGARDRRILFVHLLPNVLPYVIVAASSSIGGIILAEASLSFLGLGVTPGTPSWGADLAGRNRGYFLHAPWLALAPGLAISLTVLGFNLFGDALRDVLDPRLRGAGRAVNREVRRAAKQGL